MAIPSAEDVENYNITELILFLREQNLGLAEEYLDKIENERINGKTFRLLTRQDLRNELKFPLGETLFSAPTGSGRVGFEGCSNSTRIFM
jgi:hypothetical protein